MRCKRLFIARRYFLIHFWNSCLNNFDERTNSMNQMLDKANSLHPNIKLVRQLGTAISFLDVFIENKDVYGAPYYTSITV